MPMIAKMVQTAKQTVNAVVLIASAVVCALGFSPATCCIGVLRIEYHGRFRLHLCVDFQMNTLIKINIAGLFKLNLRYS